MSPRRREVWFVGFDPTCGHEQAGVRPALILSVDQFNSSAAKLVTVLPITSKHRALRTRVAINPPEAGLTMVSYVMCEQVRTISTQRLTKSIGIVSTETINAVETIVRMLLGL